MGRESRNQTYHQNVRLQIQIKYDIILQNMDYRQSISPHKWFVEKKNTLWKSVMAKSSISPHKWFVEKKNTLWKNVMAKSSISPHKWFVRANTLSVVRILQYYRQSISPHKSFVRANTWFGHYIFPQSISPHKWEPLHFSTKRITW